QGSSIDPAVVAQIGEMVGDAKRVLVCLDSNHTHDHVLEELRAYAPMTSLGSYCVVFDTLVEHLPDKAIGNRPWGRGNQAFTEVKAYLAEPYMLDTDNALHEKLHVSAAREG